MFSTPTSLLCGWQTGSEVSSIESSPRVSLRRVRTPLRIVCPVFISDCVAIEPNNAKSGTCFDDAATPVSL